MKSSELYLNSFSHIYVERDVFEYEKTTDILRKVVNGQVIVIDNYKDVFNRPKQDFLLQKKSQKLILAKKRDEFLYKGSELCENFGYKHFFYTSNILNCIYDCEYCYLRGLYNSSNIVIFVNIEDFFRAIDEETKDKKIYVALSYDSDILAFEGLTGFCNDYIDYAKKNKNVLFEIRTKSSNFNFIAKLDIPENVILAWTLLPDDVIKFYENKTPSLDLRLKDIKAAQSKGLRVRLSIEPIIKVRNFEKIYKDFIEKVFKELDKNLIRDINVGAFRMSKEHIKRIRKLNPYSKIFSYKFVNKEGYVSYDDEENLREFIISELKKYIEEEKIY
ncbi:MULTISPECIES: SPL family radical SAM protein [Caloramator]|uniref:Spore photoproduct lyase n=1 Tax=Caloramator australicus RC3 TaxID=857293 RepID=I7K636_9CLOT|nr:MULTISPECIES: spore photoproduct lyase [Caloramator]MDO6353918.1 radical SAM protein [Caloramator sp. CAR-1]CCJ33019.1 Spore photoproduct lyase [Caloramator australicus RC3]